MTNTTYKKGNLRGEKIAYPDGDGCCIWYPLSDENDNTGIAFDFPASDIDKLIGLLQALKTASAEPMDA